MGMNNKLVRKYGKIGLVVLLALSIAFNAIVVAFALTNARVVDEFRSWTSDLLGVYEEKDYSPQLEAARLQVEEAIRQTLDQLMSELENEVSSTEAAELSDYVQKLIDAGEAICQELRDIKDTTSDRVVDQIKTKIADEYQRQIDLINSMGMEDFLNP